VRKVVRELRKEGFIIRGRMKIEIVNIVGTADAGGEVDLRAREYGSPNKLDELFNSPARALTLSLYSYTG